MFGRYSHRRDTNAAAATTGGPSQKPGRRRFPWVYMRGIRFTVADDQVAKGPDCPRDILKGADVPYGLNEPPKAWPVTRNAESCQYNRNYVQCMFVCPCGDSATQKDHGQEALAVLCGAVPISAYSLPCFGCNLSYGFSGLA